MASSVPLLIVGLLVLAAAAQEVVMCQQDNSDGGDETLEIMEKEELSGLYEFMDSLIEDPTTWSQTHPQPCSDTSWPGLQCEISDDDQNPPIFHVTGIHIGPDGDVLTPPCKPSANLSALSLLKLPYLKTLSLFNCFTSSPVSLPPTLFGSFSSLEQLALESNPSLSGEIPPTLFEVFTLRVLCLSQNNLQGEIPENLGGLSRLEQLDLSYNNLTSSIPQEIGELKSLTILDLSWNGLEGHLPTSLGQLKLLQKIDLCSNKLHGKVPPSFGNLKRLVLLDLSHNLFNGPIPETLSGLRQLQYLFIQDNPINTGVPLFLGTLRNLMVLGFSMCGLKGPLPNSVSSLKNLTALSLECNSLNGTVPPNLGTLPHLDQLNLSHNQLGGELTLPEVFITRLGKRLDVRGNSGICLKQELYKDKNISTYLETPPCLGTSAPEASNRNSSTWSGQGQHHPGDCNTLNPFQDRESNSSSSTNLGLDHQELVLLPCLVVWFMTFSL